MPSASLEQRIISVQRLAYGIRLEQVLRVSYKGTVRNGVVVLPPEVKLPEGAPVEVIPEVQAPAEDDPFIAAIRKVAKPRPHWPRDYIRNLDHHLYGVSKTT